MRAVNHYDHRATRTVVLVFYTGAVPARARAAAVISI
jgi:hypothetical protein